MPDNLTNFLIEYRDGLWVAFMGLLGSIARLGLEAANGTPLKPGMVVATVLSGMCFAALGPSSLQSVIALPDWAVGATGFIWGLVGVAVANMFVRRSNSLNKDEGAH